MRSRLVIISILATSVVLLILALSSCDSSSTRPVVNQDDALFPLHPGTTWLYEREFFVLPVHSPNYDSTDTFQYALDTIQLTILDSTITDSGVITISAAHNLGDSVNVISITISNDTLTHCGNTAPFASCEVFVLPLAPGSGWRSGLGFPATGDTSWIDDALHEFVMGIDTIQALQVGRIYACNIECGVITRTQIAKGYGIVYREETVHQNFGGSEGSQTEQRWRLLQFISPRRSPG